ncbi:MAG: hypothetical protein B0D92_04705, partial [Spirochaeta sp. LUC14_002_19_P3]
MFIIGCESASTPADKAPGAPTEVTVTPTVGEVTLIWVAPTDTGIINGDGTAGTITDYKVYYSTTQGFAISGVTPQAVGSVLTTTITGLSQGTTYYFKVTASNAAGESAPSEEANTRTNGIMYSAVFKDGTGGVDGLDSAYSVAVSQDGKNVYVAGSLDDALAVFDRDTSTGALTYSAVFKDGDTTGTAGVNVDGLGGAYSVAVSLDGKNVYVAGNNDKALAVFTRNTTSGALTYSTVFKDGSGGVDGLSGARSVAVSEDGKNVYVAGFFDVALAVFDRDTSTGALTYSTVIKDGNTTGTAGVNVDGLDGANSVAVSEDGKNVYVTGFGDNALAVFDRNTTSGALSYSTVIKDGEDLTGGGNVDGLSAAWSVTVSLDGKNVYVAGANDDALAVFDRNTSTGALTYSTVFKDGDALTGGGNVDGLDSAYSVAVSEDGKNVYVAGAADNALVVFTRDTTTGALSYSTVIKNGDTITGGGNVDGLDGATSVAVSRD